MSQMENEDDEPVDYGAYDDSDYSCNDFCLNELDGERLELDKLIECEEEEYQNNFPQNFGYIPACSLNNQFTQNDFVSTGYCDQFLYQNYPIIQQTQITPHIINNIQVLPQQIPGIELYPLGQDVAFQTQKFYPYQPTIQSTHEKKDFSAPINQPHIKKPLNAFMLYMRDVRPEVSKQVPQRDSTSINQVIGKMWQSLTKEEQEKYFEMAKEERAKHKILYPDYNPRDYYAYNIKKKRRRKDKNGNDPLPKKCRARYGLDQQDKWCKHCKRKKKCLRYVEGQPEQTDQAHHPTEDARVCTDPSQNQFLHANDLE